MYSVPRKLRFVLGLGRAVTYPGWSELVPRAARLALRGEAGGWPAFARGDTFFSPVAVRLVVFSSDAMVLCS